MNQRQRESAAKYLYDISKGTLLGVLAGVLTGKVTIYGMAMAALVAVYAFVAAYILEESL